MQQENEIFEKFKEIKRKQYIVTAPIILVFILLMILYENPDFEIFGLGENILLPIAIVGVVAGLIFSLINWRCPACNGYFRKEINPKFCAKCGVKLREN